ncbi:MAG: TonB family protein [Gammaproteobacteria bacterium]
MNATVPAPQIGPDDRFAMTLCMAIIAHAMLILGVSFAPDPSPDSSFQSLEVILVPEKSVTTPEKADLLAQANVQGGGDDDQSDPPAAPVKAPIPAQTADIASSPAPPVKPASTTAPADTEANVEQLLSARTPVATLAEADEKPAERPEASMLEAVDAEPAPPQPAIETPALPTAAQLLTRSFALASLNAELQQRLDSKAKRLKRKYISANTREFRYAAYMEAWRAKVERVGNINYPDEARVRQLSGNLLLDVSLNADGSVIEITVRRSSGHKVLDDAAIRIVELASPFAAFPDDIREEVDILHITRTWKFVNNQGFRAR